MRAQESDVIASAASALNVLDFEAAARARVAPWHWAWLSTGGDDGATIRANRDGFERYQLRARRLIDVSTIDTSVRLFGATHETPIFLSPLAGHRTYDPQGELTTARAARAKRHLQLLSTMTTTAVEQVNEARGEPVWFQLYHRDDWGMTRQLLKRVESAGCPALVFTVDLLGGRNMEQFNRVQQQNAKTCVQCHLNGNPMTDLRNRPMVNALTVPATPQREIGTPTWDYIKRLRDATGMKLLVKGIVTREDAELALEHGVDGVYISNHGGRAENSLRSTVECVADVAAGVKGRAPILVDGGFRRGTDVYKALALGATAVGIGRPYIWGLASFGQEGVEAVLTILRRELELIMRQSGTTSISRISPAHIVAR
jgi:isopentenyl diphosphate isomerase/L-lactate dehydrogenase-like FMN-dependent dehydrogenase